MRLLHARAAASPTAPPQLHPMPETDAERDARERAIMFRN